MSAMENGREAYFKAINNNNISRGQKIYWLNQANYYFNIAVQSALDRCEKSSAHKNISQTYSKLIDLYLEDEMYIIKEEKEFNYAIEEYQKNLDLAFKWGNSKSIEWNNDLEDKSVNMMYNINEKLKNMSDELREKVWLDICYKFQNFIRKHVEFMCNFLCGQTILNITLLYEHNSNHDDPKIHMNMLIKARARLETCMRYLRKAIYLSKVDDKSSYRLEEINDLNDRAQYQCKLWEAARILLVADIRYNDIALGENADENLYIVFWQIMDQYYGALSVSQDVDVEIEAIICQRIGRLFAKTILDRDKAFTYYTKTIELCISMHPRNFDDCDFYKEAIDFTQKFKVEKRETENVSQLKAAAKEKLSEKISILEIEADKGSIKFLQFIYKEYPINKELGSLDPEDLKKTVLKALSHYHPDKHVSATIEQQVLMEEITKVLNSKYEKLKG